MKRAKKVTISRISPVLKVNFSLSKNSKSIIISENSTLPRSHLARIYPTHYEILEKWPIKIDSYSSLIYTPSHSILSPDPSPSEISQEINQQQELFYLSDASVQSTYLDHLLQTNSSLVFSVDLSNQTLKESSSSTQLKQENSDGDQTPILGFESHSHSQEEEDEEVIACDPSTPSPCQSNTDRLREEEPAESHGSRSDEFPSEEYKDTIRKIHTIPPLRREIGFMVKALLDYIPTQPSTNKNSKGGPEIHETNSNSEMKDTNLLSQPDLPEELQLLVSETERVADHLIRTTLWLASQNTKYVSFLFFFSLFFFRVKYKQMISQYYSYKSEKQKSGSGDCTRGC